MQPLFKSKLQMNSVRYHHDGHVFTFVETLRIQALTTSFA